MYKHDHPDSDIFKEGSEWRPKVQTLGDYVRQKTDCPCVVVGGEYGRPEDSDHRDSKRSCG